MRNFTLIAALCSIVGCAAPEPQEDHQSGPTVAPADSLFLEELFRVGLAHSEFGAVLFGDKPICIDGTPSSPDVPNFLLGTPHALYAEVYRQGIQVWENGDFHSPNFSLIRCTLPLSSPTSITIALINHGALRKVLAENITLFKALLSPHADVEQLFTSLTTPGVNIFDALGNHTSLIGIVLGYGIENAILFDRIHSINLLLDSGETVPLRTRSERTGIQADFPNYYIWSDAPREDLSPAAGCANLSQELLILREGYITSEAHPRAEGRYIPRFGCLAASKETDTLIHRYCQADLKTQKLLSSSDLLHDVKTLLCV